MPRRRRPAAETQAEIVQAAQALLLRDGPSAMRLDDVAREVGVSRQAVLHHFGSREGLMRAVVHEAWTTLFSDLGSLTSSDGTDLGTVIRRVDQAVRIDGHARLGAWLALSRTGLPDSVFEDALATLPGQVHGQDPEHARFALLLIGAALFGDAVFGSRIRQALGLTDDEASRRRFHTWLERRISTPPADPS
ncbi:MAG: TetR/AcrR family transcriptional regulator [Myxococcales bacterium]|nr:TetR/AcrR family transcriptional regulator [Myxococcales bacterium]